MKVAFANNCDQWIEFTREMGIMKEQHMPKQIGGTIQMEFGEVNYLVLLVHGYELLIK